jgi:nucleoside-triphosphatase
VPSKNNLLTGRPRCGKTTLIIKMIPLLESAGGFFTQEFLRERQRIGFKIITLSGQEGILAKKGLKSRFRLGRYGINLTDLENIGVKSIEEAIRTKRIIIIDEIAKMELFSENFKNVVLRAFDSKKRVLGTIQQSDMSFIRQIKAHQDTAIFELKQDNQEEIFEKIKELILGDYIPEDE